MSWLDAAREASPEAIAGGLAEAFRSDLTPPFPEMVADLFGRSSADERAGLLNRLFSGIGPGAMAGLPGALAGLLGGRSELGPEEASRVSPADAQEIAAQAEKQDPSVVDQVSSFYAQHPRAVQALGGLAAAIALQHIGRRL